MTRVVLFFSSLTLCACIRAPDVILVDRKTALEQLAAGSYQRLEDELTAAAITPRAEPLTRSEIEGAGAGVALTADEGDRSEAAQLDELLRRRCVGEGTDGLIAVTTATCAGRGDASERSRLVERVNRDRYQIWRELQTRGLDKGKERDLGVVRKAWRAVHLRAVVCGGQVQLDDGKWEDKKC